MRFILILTLIILGCSNTPKKTELTSSIKAETTSIKDTLNPINRTKIKADLAKKVKEKKALIIHVFVPLCDNENQGIVPVNKTLGDGDNLKTNLYWGALYGIRTHFSRNTSWKKVYNKKHQDSFLLERIVFRRKYSNGASVILVADAYNGNAMKTCLNYYLTSLAGTRKDSILIDSNWLEISANADLVAFNGHNGLMDVNVDLPQSNFTKNKDAIAIACVSKPSLKTITFLPNPTLF